MSSHSGYRTSLSRSSTSDPLRSLLRWELMMLPIMRASVVKTGTTVISTAKHKTKENSTDTCRWEKFKVETSDWLKFLPWSQNKENTHAIPDHFWCWIKNASFPAHLNSCYGAVHNVTGPEVSPESEKNQNWNEISGRESLINVGKNCFHSRTTKAKCCQNEYNQLKRLRSPSEQQATHKRYRSAEHNSPWTVCRKSFLRVEPLTVITVKQVFQSYQWFSISKTPSNCCYLGTLHLRQSLCNLHQGFFPCARRQVPFVIFHHGFGETLTFQPIVGEPVSRLIWWWA